MTSRAIFCGCLAALSIAVVSIAAPPAKPRAKPPQFSDEVKGHYFPDARKKLNLDAPKPAAGTLAGSNPGSAIPVPSPTGDAPPPTASGFAWSKLISAETLEDEIKQAQAPLGKVIEVPTSFKGGGYKDARLMFSHLAAMFGIIGQYDGDVRWKNAGGAMRTLMGKASQNCKVGTDNSWKEAKERKQDLTDLIGGGNPENRAVDGSAKWAEVVNRPPLMQRMEMAQRGRLDAWTKDAAAFKTHKDGIKREAEVLAALCQVIMDESYENGADSTYRGYASELQKHCLNILDALKTDNFSKADSAAKLINKACDDCHGDFRSN